ncbi:MAG TPA: tRNA (adenosine(37)-N6)-threonylcarbamoyltransferase complex ATPase subunit type 1 TsaE [Chloroflexi bacterium]|nr:tRNA (adenosine(37)-N6)-threonylcarbamoyltransferase complex ATPase subunit type 1 TsaE [Chloroflexota bacterium]
MSPILDRNALEIISRSAEQTRRVGMRLGAMLEPGDIVCLIGDLGAGKTTFVQGLAAGWGSLDPVSSPTFVIVNVYRRLDQRKLFHLDAYRLSGPAEAADLDLDDMFEHGSLVIEWADLIAAALPEERLWVTLRYVDENQRDLIFTAHGEHYQQLQTKFRHQVYGA